MALTTAITRTKIVSRVDDGQVAGTVVVTWNVQPTTNTPGYTHQEVLSTAEWNEIAAQQGSGGKAGIGVSLTSTSQ